MKNSIYQSPILTLIMINVELGFAQTANFEDPVVNPEQDW